MDFAFSEEQQMLRAAARAVFADALPTQRMAELADSEVGWDPSSWSRLAELGWLDAELSFLDHAVLFEEAGRALYPGPLWSTLALAVPVLPDDLRAAVGAGERSMTLAWAEPDGAHGLADLEQVRTSVDTRGRLSGTKVLVPDLTLVTDVLVTARGDSGVGVYAVDLAAASEHGRLVVVARTTTDRTRRLGELVLDATPASLVATPPLEPMLAGLRLRALAALGCEAVGVAQVCLAFAVAHAGQCEQFGRAIGTYQAISHRIADTYVEIELARSLAYWAAWCVDVASGEAALACVAAKSAAGESLIAPPGTRSRSLAQNAGPGA